jgi:hypothetical protein
LADRFGRRDHLHQHDPHFALGCDGRIDQGCGFDTSSRVAAPASARPTRSLKGDLAHVEEPRWPDTLSLVAALNFYSPDPPPPGL